MYTLSYLRPSMNLMALDTHMHASNSRAMPDQMLSSSSMMRQSSLNRASCALQTPSTSISNKGYQCTEELLLPEDFEPTSYSVICGRGRKSTDAIGNRRLAVIASLFAKRYSQATRKEDKTLIVSEILEMMQSASPNPHHAFVRRANGRWFRVQNLHAREKIGTVLRDRLHSQYRSSTKSKLAKRKQQKDSKKKQLKGMQMKKKKMEEIQPDNAKSSFSLENELHGDDLDGIFL